MNLLVDMRQPPFFIPQCDHAQLLVNVRALYLLQQHGTPSSPDIRLVAPYSSGENERYFLAAAHQILQGSKDYSRLSHAYVTLHGQFEYLYCLVKCGHCAKCLHTRQLDLINRSRMESELYSTPAYFFTLTYSTENLPYNRLKGRTFACPKPMELYKADVANFFKRLRRLWDRKGIKHNIRYIVAGEYGSRHHRPHYHVLMWNNPYGADEFRPWLHRQLKADIFTAWHMMEPQAFDFGVAGDGAAAYVSKYITKQSVYRLTHKLPPGFCPPFLHQSTGHGGIGSGFFKQRAAFFRAHPTVDTIAWTSRHDCSYHEVKLGSYAKQVLHPSPTRQVPARVRQLYRQYTDIQQQLVNLGRAYFGDAWRVLEQVRPPGCPHLLGRASPIKLDSSDDFIDFRCFDVQDGRVVPFGHPPDSFSDFVYWRLVRLSWRLHADLDVLLDAGSPIDYDSYYRFMSEQKQTVDNRGSFAGDVLHIRTQVADAVARERL